MHASNQAFDVGDWRARQNAVAKIKNERLVPEGFQDSIDRRIERSTAGKQDQRIEIALYRTLRLDILTSKIELNHPVEADYIDGNCIKIILKFSSRPAGKSDDFRTGNSLPHRCNDLHDRRDTPLLELTGWKYTSPSVKDLHRINARFELSNEVTG